MAMSDAVQEVGQKLEGHVVKDGMQQYKLVIPKPLYAEIQRIAAREHTSASDLIRRPIKLGVIVAELELEPGAELIIRRPGHPDERVLFLT